MIEFVIAGEEAEEIKCFETEMFKKYKEIVDLYVPLFYKKWVHIEAGIRMDKLA